MVTKTVYDGLCRATIRYRGYDTDETAYAEVSTVTDGVILEQSESSYDAAANVIQSTFRQRYHNASDTQLGAVGDPSTNPKARVIYQAMWVDGIGRSIATADYGTNGGASLTRPGTVPTRSDTVLINSVTYDASGDQLAMTDPAGMVTRYAYDTAGRRTSEIKNYQTSPGSPASSCTASDDVNVGQLRTSHEHAQAAGNLSRSTGTSDAVSFSYNRKQQVTTKTDQTGTVHTFDYDKLSRPTPDRITTLGSGVDAMRSAAGHHVRCPGLQGDADQLGQSNRRCGYIEPVPVRIQWFRSARNRVPVTPAR